MVIRDVSGHGLRIVINKKIIGCLIDVYRDNNIAYRLKCLTSKGKSPGVINYMPVNSLEVGGLCDSTNERELYILFSNGPEIQINY